VRVPAGATLCPDCGQDLAALVQAARKADVLFNQALAQAQEGRWAGAQARLEQALEIAPTHIEALHLVARIHARAGRSADARAAWDSVLAQAPEHAGAKAGLAWLDEADKNAAASESIKSREAARAKSKQRRNAVVGAGVAFVAGIALMAWLPRPAASTAPVAVAEAPATVIVERLIIATPTPGADVVATAVTAALDAPSQAPTLMPTPAPTESPAPAPTPSPPDLIASVKQRIADQPELQGLDIAIEQTGSDIVLTGSVPSLLTKYLAEKASADAPGVARVISQLQLTNVHVVQRGENLWDIASAVYGSPRYWRTIAKANRLRTPFRVFAGQQLILPER
jgi:nucleoid-associated protein YgaU